MSTIVKYVQKFMTRTSILPKSKKAIVCVSAGKDSMLLVYIMNKLKEKGVLNDILLLHVNHGTRGYENTKEELLVQNYANILGLSLQVLRLSKNLFHNKNFEESARNERYKFFRSHALDEDMIYTAHHIDDSYEWSLMQRFKTGSFIPTLGIPVKNFNIARPFMCLSKDQIVKFVEKYQIPYIDDSSNKDISFERNYLRLKIIPKIKKKYPSYLKNYVAQSNFLARKFNVSAFKYENQFLMISGKNYSNIIAKTSSDDFRGAKELIVKEIKRLSTSKRGKLQDQLRKLFIAIENKKKGPLSFSGNVNVHISSGHLFIINKNDELKLKASNTIKKIFTLQEFEKFIYDSIECNFPIFCRLKTDAQHLSLDKQYPAIKLLRIWKNIKNLRNKKLEIEAII